MLIVWVLGKLEVKTYLDGRGVLSTWAVRPGQQGDRGGDRWYEFGCCIIEQVARLQERVGKWKLSTPTIGAA